MQAPPVRSANLTRQRQPFCPRRLAGLLWNTVRRDTLLWLDCQADRPTEIHSRRGKSTRGKSTASGNSLSPCGAVRRLVRRIFQRVGAEETASHSRKEPKSLIVLCDAQKRVRTGQCRSAGGSPVSWFEGGQETTAGPAALQPFSCEQNHSTRRLGTPGCLRSCRKQ